MVVKSHICSKSFRSEKIKTFCKGVDKVLRAHTFEFDT